ncbi:MULTISPECIES: hypothetical protein [Gordonibacter]|uniref:hypothetical protein n=1 Tax=Gordonibacter TaxID=644652 RepID=UPI0026347B67|nr:hypothetical protein [Gordonibacter sp. RACS_AR49]MDN4510659.1 hypothetical protein [Gordonibacter sp. RACS_AR49]
MDRLLLEDAAEPVPSFDINLAGERICVSPLHERVRALCGDYLCDGVPALRVRTAQADIDAERDGPQWSDAYLETLAVYRKIAEWLPTRGRMLVHGAAVAFQGRAYLFCASSGTGKSTHVGLWREHLGSAVTVINGDKPIVRVPADGGPAVVYGTPWAGKEGWQANTSAPLAGICLLGRAEPGASRIRRARPAERLDAVLRQAYLPADPLAAGLTLELLDALLARVPLFDLACDVSEDAVRCSFEALSGRAYDDWKISN